jgi:hypothetical protein
MTASIATCSPQPTPSMSPRPSASASAGPSESRSALATRSQSAAPSASDVDLGEWSRRYAAAHDAPGVPEDPAAVFQATRVSRALTSAEATLPTASAAAAAEGAQ